MPLRNLNILIVADRPDAVTALVDLLERAGGVGRRPTSVGTLGAALAALHEKRFDAILLDLSLPDASGLDAVEALRRAAPSTALVVVTDQRDPELPARVLAAGAQDYLLEGRFDGDLLVRAVRHAVERAGAEARLRDQEALFRGLADSLGEGVLLTDLEMRLTYVNPRLCEMSGYPQAELLGRSADALFLADEDLLQLRERIAAVEAGHTTRYEQRARRADGGWIWVEVHAAPFRNANGEVVGVVAAVDDISERRRAAEALRESEQRLQDIVENSNNLFYSHTPDHVLTYVSPRSREMLDCEPEEALGSWTEFITEHPINRQGMAHTERALATGERQPSYELELQSARGRRVWVEVNEAPVVRDGQVVAIVGALADITERKRTEEQLERTREQLRRVIEHARTVFYTCRPEPPFACIFVSDNVPEEWGVEAAEFLRAPDAWSRRVHPEDLPRHDEVVAQLRQQGRADWEYRFDCGDGRYRWIRDELSLVLAEGEEVVVGMMTDITEHRQLEDQLRQAQKMEAIGRLAGGVAHDFNNLLTAISGYTELLAMRLVEDTEAQQDLGEIRKASERAAALTRQLLAFSRRQVLQARIVDPNTIVRDMEKMLRRVIGEDVTLDTRLQPQVGTVRVDPGQLEQVIMNLAVNARDAMPEGGRLILESREVTLEAGHEVRHVEVIPGRYVQLAVSDTGQGMSREVLEHVFEPFFTTKQKGKGTGLGLSMVYGIVKQSGGYIFAYSEPGQGATFKVYLPLAGAGVEPTVPKPDSGEHRLGTESVLLVEDDEAVRTLVMQALSSHGYRVTAAATGAAAREACQAAESPFDLLVSDVVMQDTRGPVLEQELRALWPTLRSLFISGYTEATIFEQKLPPAAHFLQKPFTPRELLRAVRAALAAPVATD